MFSLLRTEFLFEKFNLGAHHLTLTCRYLTIIDFIKNFFYYSSFQVQSYISIGKCYILNGKLSPSFILLQEIGNCDNWTRK